MLVYGWGVSIREGVFINRMGCLYTGWSVEKQDRVLIYRMSC